LHAITYDAPATLEQAVSILKTHGENARAFCGGTDIIIQLRAGVRRTEHLVDIKKIKELCALSFDAKKGLRLGAAVPCIEIFENDLMRKHYPGLTEAAHLIGSLQIQNRASVGGNLCNGSPAADTTPASRSNEEVNADTAMGTSCSDCSRFCAVTTISCSAGSATGADSCARTVAVSAISATMNENRCISSLLIVAISPRPIVFNRAINICV